MNAISSRSRPLAPVDSKPADVGEIHTYSTETPAQALARPLLLPAEEALSLPAPAASIPTTIAPLTRFLGPLLTVANPVWSGDPVPRMRGLQKKLVEHSLMVPEGRRGDFMAGISVVENAVRLRLRFQQMHMNEVEMQIKPEGAKQQ